MSKVVMPPKGTTQKYPWEIWEDGEPHEARRGTKVGRSSFTTSPRVFVNTLTNRASRRGRSVETRVQGDTVIFRFFDKSPGLAAIPARPVDAQRDKSGSGSSRPRKSKQKGGA